MNTAVRYGSAFPDYCPDDLDEAVPCSACGADAGIAGQYCRARHNGPRPRPLVHLVLIDKVTGEIVATSR